MFWTISWRYLDNIWAIFEQYLDNILTIFGQYLENSDSIYTIFGQYLDNIWKTSELQIDYFFRYPDFPLKNVRIMYLANSLRKWCIRVNICLFSINSYSFGVELCLEITVFYPFCAKFTTIYCNHLKMSGFFPKNVRYPRYQNTKFLQLWKTSAQFSYNVWSIYV